MKVDLPRVQITLKLHCLYTSNCGPRQRRTLERHAAYSSNAHTTIITKWGRTTIQLRHVERPMYRWTGVTVTYWVQFKPLLVRCNAPPLEGLLMPRTTRSLCYHSYTMLHFLEVQMNDLRAFSAETLHLNWTHSTLMVVTQKNGAYFFCFVPAGLCLHIKTTN